MDKNKLPLRNGVGIIVLNKNNQEIYSSLKLFPRQALHAHSLSFDHPRNNKRLSFEVKPPIDIQNLLENLNDAIDKV